MGIIDRIILSIYTFLLTLLSLGIVLLAMNLIPLDFLRTGLVYISGQWEAGLVGAIFLLVSVRLMLAGLRSKTSNDTIIHHTDMGDVHITVDAVENLVEKTARNTRGVRGAKVKVTCCDGGVKVRIKAVISPESSVPAVGTEIQKRVHEYIKNTVGVELAEIHILVNNISNEFKVKQRVE